MIRFGLRLAVAGGREAVTRLVIIAGAVMLGVGLLLATVAAVNAVSVQFGRFGWMDPRPASASATEPAWWLHRGDYFDGRPIDRIDVAGTGSGSPVPAGIPRLPGPGEYYASPGLHALLASTPGPQLADRFAGREIGTIDPPALPSPDSLVVIVGRAPNELETMPDARPVTDIATTGSAIPVAALDLVLSVVAGGLLFPVLIFIGAATRLTATRREQRFAAMRLIGATPRQISVIAAVEASVAAGIGTALGFALYFLLRPGLAAIPLTGLPFFPGDLSLNPLVVALVVAGVPAGAAIASRIALRRVHLTPLGVVRSVTPRAPRAYRLIPLALGAGELAFFVGRRPETSHGQVAAFLPGFLLMMVGLVVAGPWLTMVGARVLARRSRRPATLIAARRLADNPRASFRAISGVVLALFVTSVAIGVITTIVANRGSQQSGVLATTLSKQFEREQAAVPEAVLAEVRSTPGVRSVTVVHRNPLARAGHNLPGVAACADLAQAPEYGHCGRGVAVAQVWSDLLGFRASPGPGRVWPPAPLPVDEVRRLPVQSIVVSTDGTPLAIEGSRTILELAYPDYRIAPATEADFDSAFRSQLAGFQQLANVLVLASLPIAGCSLAISVAGGLSERKRPFSLLRLSGVPLRVLRRVVALESAAPLLAVSVVAIGAGFLAAHLFLRAQMTYSLRPPGPAYFAVVGVGLIASLGIIAATLPLLERITGPETARNG
jgi:hypothetical protein